MKHILFVLFFFGTFSLNAQEHLGLRLENYAGVNGISLNPAANLTNPMQWDLNLVGIDFFIENNYFFIEETNNFDLLKRGRDASFFSVPDLEGAPPNNSFLIDYYSDDKKRFGYLNASITGPSIAVKIGENQSVGLFTKARMATGTQNLQNEFSYYTYDNRPFFAGFPTQAFESAFISWSEVGLNYTIQIPTEKGDLGLGISTKLLSGYEAAWFQFEGIGTYEKVSRNSSQLSELDVSYGFTHSNLIEDPADFDLQKNGTGIAFDLGLINIIRGSEKAYDFKLGVSILDLGFINFNKNMAVYRLQTDSLRLIGGDQYEQYNQLGDLFSASELFSQQALLNPTASRAGDKFKLWLPTALSIQADYAFTENIFFNALLIQRLSVPRTIGLERGNLFAFTPRFEHRWFSASMPLSFYNWQDFRVGLAARLAFLTVGSDNLGSFFGRSDYTGTDFYMALKINFNGKNGGSGFGKGRRGGRGGNVKCYDF